MAIRFVTPETEQLPLPDGDFIIVKKRLTHGERDDMQSRMMPLMTPGQEPQVDTKDARTIQVLAYLLGWSSEVPIGPELPEQQRMDTLKGLDPDDFDEIERVIVAHIKANGAKKKRTRGVSAPEAISALVG